MTFAVGAEGAFGFRQRPKGQFAHEIAPFFHEIFQVMSG
jgi:hypothetical protein